jgi:hypothetical protein
MIVVAPNERIDSFDKLLKTMKELPIKIGDVTLLGSDFKDMNSFKPWKSMDHYDPRDRRQTSPNKQLRAKFVVIVRLVRRYIKYHRESQFLISFINSKETYLKSRRLLKNKEDILAIMESYLESFNRIQPLMFNLEKVLKYLEDANASLKTVKYQELLQELYQIEKLMQKFCVRMNELLRDSDEMIATSSYDDDYRHSRSLRPEAERKEESKEEGGCSSTRSATTTTSSLDCESINIDDLSLTDNSGDSSGGSDLDSNGSYERKDSFLLE